MKVNGTKASDVVCNDELKTDSTIPTPAPSNIRVSFITRFVSQVKQRTVEHVQIQELLQRSTTTSPPGHDVSTKVKQHPFPPSTDNSPGKISATNINDSRTLDNILVTLSNLQLVLFRYGCTTHFGDCWTDYTVCCDLQAEYHPLHTEQQNAREK